MEGTIVNFRGSHHTQKNNQMIIKVDGVDTKDKASKLIGKKVTWKTPSGKEMTGKITKEHGNKGALRVIFEKGLPGQAVSTKVKVE
jgi:large subunit ribosomal protein L35Ae